MTVQQYIALLKLTRIKKDSKAAVGAALVLINKMTQQEAATMLDCQQCTISKAVRRIKEVDRLARQIA